MKVEATFHVKNFNPFTPNLNDFVRQISKAEAEVPEDSDWEQLESWAKEMTPEGFEFKGLKRL